MMRNFSILICILNLSGVLLFSQAAVSAEEKEILKTKADTNREVALTYAQIYLEQKLYGEAEGVLQESIKNDGESGPVLNLLGLIQLEEKNYAQACFSFQSASVAFQDSPERVYALYNLADCFHRGGRNQDSINVLKDLTKKEMGVTNSAEMALELIGAGLVKSGGPLPPFSKRARGQFRFSAAAAGGFDTNVVLVEDSVASVEAISNRGSFFVAPALQFGYLGRMFGTTLDSRFITAYTDYTSAAVSGFNNLFNRVDMLFGTETSKFGFFADLTFLNRTTFGVYNYDAGVTWQRLQKIGGNQAWMFEVPIRYQKFVLAAGTLTTNDRSGGDLQVKVTRLNQWSERESLSIPSLPLELTTDCQGCQSRSP